MRDKFIQLTISLLSGAWIAIESTTIFLIPCLIATLLDVYSAFSLARRVHRLQPNKSDGKFKSEYKGRVLKTLILGFVAVILAHYIDAHILHDSDLVTRFTVGTFLFYQLWSVLENWSSENEGNKIAKILQKIMVSKVERHFEVDLSDIKEDANPTKTTDDAQN